MSTLPIRPASLSGGSGARRPEWNGYGRAPKAAGSSRPAASIEGAVSFLSSMSKTLGNSSYSGPRKDDVIVLQVHHMMYGNNHGYLDVAIRAD